MTEYVDMSECGGGSVSNLVDAREDRVAGDCRHFGARISKLMGEWLRG